MFSRSFMDITPDCLIIEEATLTDHLRVSIQGKDESWSVELGIQQVRELREELTKFLAMKGCME